MRSSAILRKNPGSRTAILWRVVLITCSVFLPQWFRQTAAMPNEFQSHFAILQAAEHSRQDPDLNRRGAHVMGFSQETTTHHFRLTEDGGVIEVKANDPKDMQTRDHIRMHLAHITRSFSEGDFRDPMNVHHELPPGTKEMQRLRKQIRYDFENRESGGRIIIRASNPEAIEAVHEFLAFQIREHHTGDPSNIPPR